MPTKKVSTKSKSIFKRPATIFALIAVFLAGAGSAFAYVSANAAITVNPPTSLRASATSPTTVSINWIPSTSTPSPSYNIFRNGTQIGVMGVWISLDGSVTYTDSTATPATTYSYYVQAQNSNGTANSNTVTVTTPAAPTANELGTIKGKISDKRTKQPLAGATASVVFYSKSNSVTTGADGTYTITGVPAGAYTLSVNAPGHVATYKKITVPGGGTVTADLSLRSTN